MQNSITWVATIPVPADSLCISFVPADVTHTAILSIYTDLNLALKAPLQSIIVVTEQPIVDTPLKETLI